MSAIAAPAGSPLSAAVIGVADMEASLSFYRDLIGLTQRGPFQWDGPAFEKFWRLPEGAKADAAFLELPGCPAGRILLLQFNALKRKPVRGPGVTQAFGLMNLNFYTADIARDAAMFAAKGFKLWSQPAHYQVSKSVGAPTEVLFDGPDTVAINLVELTDGDPSTRVGQMRAYVQKEGRTPTGLTPVVTTAHGVRHLGKAVAFYEKALGMAVIIDEILDTPQQNRFLKLPEKARSALKFMQGGHMFGKIALMQGLNYPCTDLVPAAAAPNIGYLAQVFAVQDLSAAERACADLRAETYSGPMDLTIPGFGRCGAMTVRNPGSGALQTIVQPL